MSGDLFEEIRRAKRENYEKIYSKGGIEGDSEAELREAFEKLYDRCLQDINEGDESPTSLSTTFRVLSSSFPIMAAPMLGRTTRIRPSSITSQA